VDWFELIINEHSIDPFEVLHAYYLTQAGFIAAYAGKYLNVPSIVSIRGNDIERNAFDPSKFTHTIYALQHATAVTTNSRILAAKARAFVDRKVIEIPNGIDTDLFKPMERNEKLERALGIKKGAILGKVHVLGFFGELRAKKGMQLLLSAFSVVAQTLPVVLLIAGDVRQGEDRKYMDDFMKSNHQLKIIITGFVPHIDLPSYYSLIDILVHPSLRDGMPNTILEALACGKPVIATPVGGVQDINKINNIIVESPLGHVNTLAAKIKGLLEDNETRKQLSQEGPDVVKHHYSLKQELSENTKIYKKIIAQIKSN